MRFVLMACVLLAVWPLEAQQSGLCTIEGRTVDAGTDKALRGVRLTLRVGGEQLASPGIEVLSDPQGHFRFADLRPGSYILLGARQDYATFAYRSRITLSPAQRVTGLVLHLVRSGRITGSVVDDRGKRVAFAIVAPVPADSSHAPPVDGRGVAEGTADARGNFDFRNLPPGQYLVWASPARPRPSMRGQEGAPPGLPVASGRALHSSYHPSAPNAASATRLEVRPGKRASNITVTLRKGTVYVIAGRLINRPAAVPNKNLLVSLRSQDSPLTSPRPVAKIESDDGFIVRDVEPGTYDLYLEELIPQSYVGNYGGATGILGLRRRGGTTVRVTGQDIAGVTLSY
jgi:hypothetical protein